MTAAVKGRFGEGEMREFHHRESGVRFEYPCEYAPDRHNAFADSVIDRAMAVAFLAKRVISRITFPALRVEPTSKAEKSTTVHQQVFTKIPVRDTAALFIKFPDAFSGQEAHLTVPFFRHGRRC